MEERGKKYEFDKGTWSVFLGFEGPSTKITVSTNHIK